MPKLDEQQYEAGRQAFSGGVSIRNVAERFSASGELPGVLEDPDDEIKTMSFAIGFADALLDMLRSLGK